MSCPFLRRLMRPSTLAFHLHRLFSLSPIKTQTTTTSDSDLSSQVFPLVEDQWSLWLSPRERYFLTAFFFLMSNMLSGFGGFMLSCIVVFGIWDFGIEV